MSFFEENHIDNGVLVGAILLCLKEGEDLKAKDLIKIQKNLSLIDAKKGASLYLNPDLIQEESAFFLATKVYTFDKKQDSWHLLNRKMAELYFGDFVNKDLKQAVQKSAKIKCEVKSDRSL